MKKRIINIFTNDTIVSKETENLLVRKLENSGFVVPHNFTKEAELIVCIGGDGAFIQAVHRFNFPHIPFIGINTGHLGFFQEIHPDQLDDFVFNYKQGKYSLQPLSTVKATIILEQTDLTAEGNLESSSFYDQNDETKVYYKTGNKNKLVKKELKALNEIVIKGSNSYTIHFNMSIGGSFIERFSGDGLLIATPAGSTAYNYSLGGSIVDPRLKLLQVTPIAPMNTTAYRSFTSSILLPSDLSLGIMPENQDNSNVLIATDGMEYRFDNIKNIEIEFSKTVVNLLRFESYDFWNKVKTKFL